MITTIRRAACGALLATLLAGPAAAQTSDHDRMAMHGPALTCVPTTVQEKAAAVARMDGRDVMLQCMPSQMMTAGHAMIGKVAAKTRAYGPNVDNLLTPGEIDAAWTKWTAELLHLDRMQP